MNRRAGGSASRLWLLVAAALVGSSALFAVLVALARVPAIGALLPGDGFYRTVLTMHVTYAQGAWFAACACALMAVGADSPLARRASASGAILVALAAVAMAVAATRLPPPVMSNYFPVLDHGLFLAAGVVVVVVLLAFAGAYLVGGGVRFAASPAARCAGEALCLFAVQVWVAAGLGIEALLRAPPSSSRLDAFETLFWGAGHAWQYALVTLMLAAWARLAGDELGGRPERIWRPVLALAAMPSLLAVLAVLRDETGSAAQFLAHTDTMRYASWPAPLLLFAWLGLRSPALRADPGFVGVLLLLLSGLWLGTRIAGETTLVTAHYHGTVGAISLSLMCWAAREPLFGSRSGRQVAEAGALLYAAGVWLMMAGLAGAGWSGAPRKSAGDLSLSLSIETMSRFGLGVGGLLATVGLLAFAWGIIGNGVPGRDGRVRA